MNVSSLLRGLLAIALVALAPAARAGGFSTTNVQLLQGYNFDDPIYFTDGRMTTVTINHFSTWEYGDNFAFADFYSGHFKNFFDPAQESTGYYKLYAEWHPRLFLNKLLGQEKPLLGFIKNWGLAGELNQSENFGAYLAGVGFDLKIPYFAVAGLNLYYRYDSFLDSIGHANQWQVSPFWTVPFSIAKVPFLFTGFVDVNGSRKGDSAFTEVWAQPELLVDALAPFGGKKDRLYVGTEWFYHRHPAGTASVPQVMLQWTVY